MPSRPRYVAGTLFDLDVRVPAPREASPAPAVVPEWRRYRGRRKCDECLVQLHERRGRGPMALSARWRHSPPDGIERVLCALHARLRPNAVVG